MTATIYHFSGTGNSLKIARDLAEALGDTELVALARAEGDQLSPAADTVGIVFPVYAWGPPLVVRKFLERVTLRPDQYVFAACTCGGNASGTLLKVKKQLRARGIKLSSGFVVQMPTNYIIWGEAPPEDEQQKMFDRAAERISEICTAVNMKKVREVEMRGPINRLLLSGLIYRLSIGHFAGMDKNFSAGDACNGCGICEKICQVGNIKMDDGKPAWHGHCEQCLACLQWCPQEAIQFGTKTVGRKRYHHPDVKAKDLMEG